MSQNTDDKVLDRVWPLCRYGRRGETKWETITDPENLKLHVKAGQMLVLQAGTVLESLQLVSEDNMRGILKETLLIVAVKNKNSARRFRIKFSTLFACKDAVAYLRNYFLVQDLTKPMENQPLTVNEMYQKMFQTGSEKAIPRPDPLPQDFPLAEAVHLAILDPSFPDLVARVRGILQLNTTEK